MKLTPEEMKAKAEEKEQAVAEFLSAAKKRVQTQFKFVPKSYQYKYMLALKGELGRAESAKLHCIECCGWSYSEVKKCASDLCPMYFHRPK